MQANVVISMTNS